MISSEFCLLKILKYLKKTSVNNKRSVEVFVKKILLLKPIRKNKKLVKQNADAFICEGDTE